MKCELLSNWCQAPNTCVLPCLYCLACTALSVLPLCVLQEEYIKEEQKNLKRELLRAQEEVKRIQSVPLVIGQFLEMVNATSGIVGSTTGVAGTTPSPPRPYNPPASCTPSLHVCIHTQL